MNRRAALRLFAALPLSLLAACGQSSGSHPLPQSQPSALTPAPTTEYRAVWLSYLELQQADYSSAQGFTLWADSVFGACRALGLNRVIAQVRPFCDALYPSRLFPYSHICSGAQGADPGFDPLELLVTRAHQNGLALEAWVNPYRVQLNGSPGTLAAENPALLHPDWAKEAAGGLYLNPALAPVQDYVAQGLAELVAQYALDGVQFDDYFYPTTDPAFDAQEYAAAGSALPLEDWRRENVTHMLQKCYQAVKKEDAAVPFGISPQGNISNNFNGQYLDVEALLAAGDCLDFVCPQLYWGLGWQKNGSDRYAFDNIAAEWAALPRAAGVALYYGLGAYRIGDGDGGGEASLAFWSSGSALAQQIAISRACGAAGYALFRYDHLMAATDLAAAEREALTACNAAPGEG